MKIFINPKYSYLEPEIRRVVRGDYTPTKVFCNHRNVVEKVLLGGGAFVVKKFKRPTWANCLIYTLFRKSKARRAYEHALLLLENGIATPYPVAYVEIKKHGLFHTGYFFSEFVDLPTLADASEEVDDLPQMGRDLIRFTVELNNKCIMPLDYNPSNIFYSWDEEQKQYMFALTDINRMRRSRFIGNRDCMRAFEQFGISTEHLYHFLLGYSIEKGADVERCMFLFLGFRLRSRLSRLIKGKVKETRRRRRLRYNY